MKIRIMDCQMLYEARKCYTLIGNSSCDPAVKHYTTNSLISYVVIYIIYFVCDNGHKW